MKITLPTTIAKNEALPQIRDAFRNRSTIVVGEAMFDYCPYEGLRYTKGDGEVFIAAADKEVEPIHTSASTIYDILFKEPREGTHAVRTSRDVIASLELVLDSDDTPDQVRDMKLTSFKGGGYVHVPLAHKKEVLEIVDLALVIAGEILYGAENARWTPEEELQDIKKEIASLEKLYNNIESL